MEVELELVCRRIGALRAAEGLRLADLAEATGYTVSYLSQIERGVSIPSLTALATLASALGVEMVQLFDDLSGPRVTVTRAGQGDQLKRTNGTSFRVISRLGGSRPYTAIVQGIDDSDNRWRHFGERFVMTLAGAVEIRFGDELHRLGVGDTLHYGALEEHSVLPEGHRSATALFVSRPALF